MANYLGCMKCGKVYGPVGNSSVLYKMEWCGCGGAIIDLPPGMQHVPEAMKDESITRPPHSLFPMKSHNGHAPGSLEAGMLQMILDEIDEHEGHGAGAKWLAKNERIAAEARMESGR